MVISKYINTTPVSGCRNVSIDGIITIIITLIRNRNSSFIVGLSYLLLKSFIIRASVNISIIFINSLGCIVPTPGMLNHALALFMVGANKSNAINDIIPIIYKIYTFY